MLVLVQGKQFRGQHKPTEPVGFKDLSINKLTLEPNKDSKELPAVAQLTKLWTLAAY